MQHKGVKAGVTMEDYVITSTTTLKSTQVVNKH